MKNLLKLLLPFIAATAIAGEVGNYPNAGAVSGSERILADQGGPSGPSTSGNTVNITPSQLSAYFFPGGYLPASLMPILTGDCSTQNGSFSITCLKSNGVPFSSLATVPNSSAIVNLFSGCSGVLYLGADGGCHPPGGVTSVALTMPGIFSVTGSPIVTSGTFGVSFNSQLGNQVFAAPSGSSGTPGFRSLTALDLPLIPLSGVTGILAPVNGGSGEAGTITGVLKANAFSTYTAAASTDVTALWTGGCSSVTFLRGDGTCATPPGQGTVNSVSLSAPAVFTVTGSPITTSGTLGLSFAGGQTANQVLASPSGSTGAISLRALTTTDLPLIPLSSGVTGLLSAANGGTGENTVTGILYGNANAAHTAATSGNVTALWTGSCSSATFLRGDGACQAPTGTGTVTSVALTVPSYLQVSGSPITSAGTLAISGSSQSANLVLASPNGSPGALTPRALVAPDLPAIPLSTGVTGSLAPSNGGTGESGSLTGIPYANGTSAFTLATSTNVTGLFSGGCSSSTFLRGDGTCATPSGGATFQVNGTGLASATTINFQSSSAIGGLTLTQTNASAGNITLGLTGWPGSLISGNCLTNNGTTISWGACGGSWSQVTAGTNTAGNLFVGTGSTFAPTGSGIVSANEVNGATVPTSAALLASNASNQLAAVTLGNNLAISSSKANVTQPINPQTGTTYTVATTDWGNLITTSNASAVAVSLPVATTSGFGTGFWFKIQNKGAGTATITPTTSTINGAATLVLPTGTGCTVASDATNYQVANCTALTAGTVTSVAATVPAFLTVSGSPVTGSGTLAISYSGTAIPVANGGSGATTLTGPLKGNGTSALSAAGASDIYGLWAGTCSSSTYLRGDGTCAALSGSGTVTSVALSVPTWLSVSGSPVTTSGTLSVSGASQSANLVLASPNGSAGAVSPRAIVAADIAGAVPASAAVLGSNSSSALIAYTLGGNLCINGSTLGTCQTINPQTGTSYSINTSDAGKLVTFSNTSAIAVTLAQATTTGYTAGFSFDVQNLNTGLITITPTTSTINGQSTFTLSQNTGCTFTSDGANYQISACTAASAGGAAFSGLTNGTNTSAAMLVGSGASLGPTGTGTLTANALNTLSAAPYVNLTGQTSNTAVNGLKIQNSTAATSGNQQYICAQLSGSGYGTTGAASQEVDWLMCNVPSQNTTAGSQLIFEAQTASSGYSPLFEYDYNVSGVGNQMIVFSGMLVGTISTNGTSCSSGPGIKENSGASDLGLCSGGATVGHFGSTGFTNYYPFVSASTISQFTIASGTGACATTSTKHGGAIAGDFICTGTTGASTVTLTLPAVPTGYVCIQPRDATTAAIGSQTGAISTTSVTLTFTSVTANDVIQFGCPISY